MGDAFSELIYGVEKLIGQVGAMPEIVGHIFNALPADFRTILLIALGAAVLVAVIKSIKN